MMKKWQGCMGEWDKDRERETQKNGYTNKWERAAYGSAQMSEKNSALRALKMLLHIMTEELIGYLKS